jgi:hypothetical protein
MVTWSLYSVKETGVEQYKNTLLRIQYLRRPNNDLVRSKHVAEHEIYAAINWSRAWQKNVWLYLVQQEARYKHGSEVYLYKHHLAREDVHNG